MPKKIRKTGNYLRVKTYTGRARIKQYRYDDIGEPSHTQRLAAQLSNGRWVTYGYIFKISDIRHRRPTTLRILRNLGITQAQLRKHKI